MRSKLTYVIDIDDTISYHVNRDYVNATPIKPVIEKIRELYHQGNYIILFTGRGMVSCKGDVELIEKRNRKILEEWLNKHEVPYHELIFGKPLGDFYVDDKALYIEDFLNTKYEVLKGGSGSTIIRHNGKVIKTAKNSKEQYEWYRNVEKLGLEVNVPFIYSHVVDTLYMEYIDGELLVDKCSKQDINNIISIAKSFKDVDYKYKDLDKYIDNLFSHLDNFYVKKIVGLLNKHRDELIKKSSFCHGDLTLTSIIKRDSKYILIDPNFKSDYTSYLLDLAKIRQSLNDYEYKFGFSENQNSHLLKYFDSKLGEDLFLVKLLEITHWIRMFKYRNETERIVISDFIEKSYKELVNGEI